MWLSPWQHTLREGGGGGSAVKKRGEGMNVWILAWFESFPWKDTSLLPPHGVKEPELKGYLIMGSPQFASKKRGRW